MYMKAKARMALVCSPDRDERRDVVLGLNSRT
jgi:hypothetical protein